MWPAAAFYQPVMSSGRTRLSSDFSRRAGGLHRKPLVQAAGVPGLSIVCYALFRSITLSTISAWNSSELGGGDLWRYYRYSCGYHSIAHRDGGSVVDVASNYKKQLVNDLGQIGGHTACSWTRLVLARSVAIEVGDERRRMEKLVS